MGFAPEEYGEPVLKKFGINNAALLGQGAHSRVFSVDSNHVIRIFSPGTDWNSVIAVANFYNSLDISKASFGVPKIHDIGSSEGFFFSVETRLANNLEQSIMYVSGLAKETLLKNYIKSAGDIRNLKTEFEGFYGDLISADPIRTNSWSEYLILRVEASLELSRQHLRNDIEGFDELYSSWQSKVIELPNPYPDVVHGDYYPGNVIVNESNKVTEIIDFSMYTILGDWRIDPVSAIIQAELGGVSNIEAKNIEDLTQATFGIDETTINLYTIFYALMLSWRVHEDHERLYKNFCVKQIQSMRDFLS